MTKKVKILIKIFTTISMLCAFYIHGYSQILDVKKFGAYGDGKTDDTKSIQAAINASIEYASPIVYFPAGIYLIGSHTVTPVYLINYCLKIHSGITFKGEGSNSVLKLADHIFDKKDSMANAHIFFGVQINNVAFTNLQIDMNGSNNLVPENIIKNNMAIFIDNGSNLNIKNITIKNCSGTNMIAIKGIGHGLKIENSFFYNGGNYVGSQTPNKHQIDFSFVYSEWDSARIINNRIEQQNVDIALSDYTGGIELHGSYSYASGNTIIGCNPGCYISSSWHPVEGTIVTNNKFEQCVRGISFWVQYPLDKITISNNTINLTYSRISNQAFITGIEVPNGNAMEYSFKLANASTLSNLLITGNTITAVLNDTTKNKTIGLLLHSLRNSRIENNTITGMNYGGVVLQGSKWGMQLVTFEKNIFNAFKTNNDAQAVAGYVVITDTYSNTNNIAPGIKDIFFTGNTFNRANAANPNTTGNHKTGTFLGGFVALPAAKLNGIHFDNNIFSDPTEKIVLVKTD